MSLETTGSTNAVSRRHFVTTAAVTSVGLVIAFHVDLPGRFGAALAAGAAPDYPPNAFLKIAPDGTVTFLCNKSEMGQGVYTSMAQIICEELDCDWSKVKVEGAPVAPVYNHTLFGSQMTGGSTALMSSYDQHRMIGASARAMLVGAAAAQWQVPAAGLKTENGFVIDPKSKKKLSYGELATAAEAQPRPDPKTLKLKDPKAFKLIGKTMHRVDAPAKVNGTAKFGIDVRLPGQVFAVVARSPVFGGKLKSFDATKTKKVPGVLDAVQIPTGVAIIAKDSWSAQQGRVGLITDWDLGDGAKLQSETMKQDFTALAQTAGKPAKASPDADAAMKGAHQVLEAKFDFPYLAHATMEPMNCTVDYDGAKAHIYTGTHMQTVDHFRAAEILGLAPDKVELTTTFLGGSFGRRANPSSDFVTEAAHVAKAVKKPVQVLWTREDDMRGGQYRPLVHHAVKVGLDKAGKIVAWKHTIVATSIIAGTQFEKMMMKDGIDPTSVEGVADSPYAIPNLHVELHSPKLPIPVQWWRSVGHSHSAYVMETMIDEVAAATKQDPLALRLALLAKHPRQVAVLKTLKDKAGWSKPLAKGRARGISIHESFGSVVGHVAEVSMNNGQPRVHRIVSAVHCGRVVNPGGATAQVESGIAYGLSAALYGAITLKDGRPEQGNFDTYRVLSAAEMPKIEVHFIPSDDNPTGLGEPGLPPTGPAVANAMAKLTGKRVRALPLLGRDASA